jgi:MarR family transcriptional regulator, transcriptional regulator for hemolysin
LRRALHRMLRQRLVRKTERPFQQLLALWVISRREVRTQTELAERLLTDRPAASRLVAKLEADGLLRKRPGVDRRSAALEVTPRAHREIAAFGEGLRWLNAEVRRHLGRKEEAVVVKAMERLRERMG